MGEKELEPEPQEQATGQKAMGDTSDMLSHAVVEGELTDALFEKLLAVPTFDTLGSGHRQLFANAAVLHLEEGADFRQESSSYFAVLSGTAEVEKTDGADRFVLFTLHTGETFGEVPLLLNLDVHMYKIRATAECTLVRLRPESFWDLMSASPSVRARILENFSRRLQSHQAMAMHKEKLISLGTMAAGLMHELNNPGAAASRAAAQLRENILKLQHISLRMTRTPLDPAQLECLAALQEQALSAAPASGLSSLEQSDREEEMADWLGRMGIDDAWRLAPIIVSAGWGNEDIACARESFAPDVFSDALNYLAALISSMQQVSTIEESISRVTELVHAVKRYAYDDKRPQAIDVRESLTSTLTILGHKLRHKSLQVDKQFPPEKVLISCMGMGLGQVWTNLLDNAIDASPEGGHLGVKLWTDKDDVCVAIRDEGPGIPPEHQDHIFQPFYTTKAAGVGTGLGLDIAHRIVVERFKGTLSFQTEPGSTEFLVRLPLAEIARKSDNSCSISSD